MAKHKIHNKIIDKTNFFFFNIYKSSYRFLAKKTVKIIIKQIYMLQILNERIKTN